MNYAEQQTYLNSSRIWAAVSVLIWIVFAMVLLRVARSTVPSVVAAALVVMAVGVSLLYTPDYLHLTVNPNRRARWQVMIRWRIIAAALLVGCLCSFFLNSAPAGHLRDAGVALIATAWLASANLLARNIQTPQYFAAYFWITDLTLLAALLLSHACHPLVGVVLMAAAAHLSIVVSERSPFPWAAAVVVMAWLTLLFASLHLGLSRSFLLSACAIVLASAATTAGLARRAQLHHLKNTQAALHELTDFTGYPREQIWRMWSESDKELARNWVAAALDESDSRALADWYQQNSELYMFASSAYNLDYRRIRSNLKVLRFAHGASLDYGAGNGEIVLEMARRGHPTTYYDVDGMGAKFAKYRAQRQGLDVRFLHAKGDLKAAALQTGFDTVFSLDVLEHLPDLPGELAFLASLLSPSGRMVFDLPSGKTKSHPMHLNHALEVRSFLRNKGLGEERTLWQKLPFVKQEKYVFVA